ncbi:MAG: hypothetical protein E5299_01104 [Burkholderia gladioli]|nr:MAG: hypothetical protein E5299_01104 [Burkholderia gladioli]
MINNIDLFVARNLVDKLGQSVTVSYILIHQSGGTDLTDIRVEREIDLHHVSRFE